MATPATSDFFDLADWRAVGGSSIVIPFAQAPPRAILNLGADHLKTTSLVERRIVARLAPVFASWSTRAAERVEDAVSRGDASRLLDTKLERDFLQVMRAGSAHAFLNGLQFERRWIESASGEKRQDVDFPDISVEMDPKLEGVMRRWLDKRTPGIWSKVSESIRKRMADTIARAVKEGLTLPKRIKELETVLKLPKSRLERIARTEATGGMNAGQHAEREDAGVEQKEWVSTIDGRTRSGGKSGFDHLSCAEQVRDNDVPFDVSGQRMMYPGDWTLGATAGNIINCRCAAVGHFKRRRRLGRGMPAIKDDEPDTKPKVDPVGPDPSIPKDAKVTVKMRRDPASKTGDRAPLKPKEIDRRGDIPRYTGELRGVDRNLRDMEHSLPMTSERVRKYERVSERFATDTEKIRKAIRDVGKDLDAVKAKRAKAFEEFSTLKDPQSPRYSTLYREIMDLDRQRFRLTMESRQAARAKLSEFRVGETAVTISRGKGGPALDYLEQTEEWLGKILGRGHGKEGAVRTQIFKPVKSSRSYQENGMMYLRPDAAPEVLIHEFGHVLENNPEVHELTKGFLFKRVGSESLKKMRDIDKRYDESERGRDDDFRRMFSPIGARYVGKSYGSASEVLSMGLEALYLDPVGFSVKDPEFFRFIVGIVSGVFL